ncbi:MAG: BrnA antitoxin family protein [Xanthomonadales bacterium]|jgi:uncharacterized protein (DUF4415 family)|nr:BrnA antitoxin family protein [Xanthomonadales bacterium]
MSTSKHFSDAEIAAAKAAADSLPDAGPVDWQRGHVSAGGGVAATIEALRRVRGPNQRPAKEQIAIRLDREVVGALRATGPGWQSRVNTVLKEWLASQAGK